MSLQKIDELELKSTLTIQQLVDYLKSNFELDDKVCYMDCIEGMKNDCTYITEDQLGERFFRKLHSNESSMYINADDVMMI